ncbi:unnamed protein product [Rhizoctonia solani]|uniref:Uncharacterized protein n=1 Tax=Rhizoctonia solani TaxID=456999 RepID=A0A8H3CDL3_9AGAM|nr:unnamed protein product [Rhizoctonia solani]
MARSRLTTSDAPHAPHAPHPDDQDSQKESELPSGSPDLTQADPRPAPRRTHSLLHGIADASQATASSGPSSVKQEASQQSNLTNSSIGPRCQLEGIELGKPGPCEQTPRACKHAPATNTRSRVAGSPANAGYCSLICAVGRAVANPVPQTSWERLDSHLPRMAKVLICGDSNDFYTAADTTWFRATCLKCWYWRDAGVISNFGGVDGLHPNDIRVHSGGGPIGEEFSWFFDPNDISPGGLLILCVTGHGVPTSQGIALKMGRYGPKLMDTFDLCIAINKIQVPCTLEIVLGTCHSEGVIPGLDRLLAMEAGKAGREPENTPPPLSTLLKSFFPNSLVPKLETKAKIIVWAAAADDGPAYPEANLPGREGKNDIMIGAICRAFAATAAPIPRRALFGKVRDAVDEYNTARDEKHQSKTKSEQEAARIAGTYCGPQLPRLLSSPGNSDLVLDSPAFRAL